MLILGILVLSFFVGAFIVAFICEAMKPREKDVNGNYIDECIKVMIAYKQGYPIEYMILDGSDGLEWRDCLNPSFNFGIASYRIKKEKHIDKEV